MTHITRPPRIPVRFSGGGGLSRAIPYNTTSGASTPWVNPGAYTVKLTVNGKSYTQPITVKQDPRVKTPALVMQQVYTLTRSAYFGAIDVQTAAQEVQRVRDQIAALQPEAKGATVQALMDLGKKIDTAMTSTAAPAVATGRGGRGGPGRGAGRGGGAQAGPANILTTAGAGLSGVMNSLQSADVQPTANQLAAMNAALATYREAMAKWTAIKTVDLPAVNVKLKAAGLATIMVK